MTRTRFKITIFAVLLTIAISLGTIGSFSGLQEKITQPPTRHISPQSASSHSNIYIIGDDQLATFATNEGIFGDGSPNFPYLFSNWSIDSGSTIHNIQLWNTTKYVNITQCDLKNDGSKNAIILTNCSNILIAKCNFSSFMSAVNLEKSNNITVKDCIFTGSEAGGAAISFSYSRNIIVKNNHAMGCEFGISVSKSNDSVIFNNSLTSNTYASFITGMNSILMEKNQIHHNVRGINMGELVNCTIRQNEIWASAESLFSVTSANSTMFEGNKFYEGNMVDLRKLVNCSFVNNTYGDLNKNVHFTKTYNCVIQNNTISGLSSDYSYNCTYSNLNMYSIESGLFNLGYGYNCTIMNNWGYSATWQCFSMANCENLRFEGNNGSSHHDFAIFSNVSQAIVRNNIGRNSNGSGIAFDACSNIECTNNVVQKAHYALFIKNSNGITVWNNSFTGSHNIEARIEGLSNSNLVWSKNNIGNYWGDYSLKFPFATKNNYYWASPYWIEDTTMHDYYPLCNSPHVLLFTDDDLEENDSPETAKALDVGQQYSCILHDNDYFSIYIEEGTQVNITIPNITWGHIELVSVENNGTSWVLKSISAPNSNGFLSIVIGSSKSMHYIFAVLGNERDIVYQLQFRVEDYQTSSGLFGIPSYPVEIFLCIGMISIVSLMVKSRKKVQ